MGGGGEEGGGVGVWGCSISKMYLVGGLMLKKKTIASSNWTGCNFKLCRGHIFRTTTKT